jgi:hypothetical protein
MSKLIAASHALGGRDGGRHEQKPGETAGEEEKVDQHARKLRLTIGRRLGGVGVKGRGGSG